MTIAGLMGLDRAEDFKEAEDEAPDVLMWLGAPPLPWERVEDISDLDRFSDALANAKWQGQANRLSEGHMQWTQIDAIDLATRKPASTPERSRLSADDGLPPPHAPLLELGFARIARQRRSAVDFDGVTGMTSTTFFGMLECLLPRANTPPWNALGTTALVHPAMMVHRVEGLAAGLYALARDPRAVPRLMQSMRPEWLWQKVGPDHVPLYLLLPHDLRQAAGMICCHQDIAADSCFALGMVARFDLALEEPWRYRQLFWECGMLGHVLYLEAEAAGVRGTGIGCYFDDVCHDRLGLRTDTFQDLYHFTVGGPVEDSRLLTLPAYAHLQR